VKRIGNHGDFGFLSARASTICAVTRTPRSRSGEFDVQVVLLFDDAARRRARTKDSLPTERGRPGTSDLSSGSTEWSGTSKGSECDRLEGTKG